MDSGFRTWLKDNYPWIRLIFVPANCTSEAQPMDAGVITTIKAFLRKQYGEWAVGETVNQLDSGIPVSEIKIASDVPSCKRNLFGWLSESVSHMNLMCRVGMVRCWEKTKLLQAWNHDVQLEAIQRASEIFPNLVQGSVVRRAVADTVEDLSGRPDAEAAWAGMGFMEDDGNEDDWMQWVRRHVEDDDGAAREDDEDLL